MRRALFSLALLTAVTGRAHAQEAKPTVLVYPFGIAATARASGGDVAGMLASRALQGVQDTERLAAINESANPAIRSQLENAMTLSQFESAVQLKTGRQLQSKYMLTGFVESVEVTPERGAGNSTRYRSVITATVSLYNVETREVMKTIPLRLVNGALAGAASAADPCAGKKGFSLRACQIKQRGKEVIAKEGEGAIGGTAGQLIADDTPTRAIESALSSAAGEIATFLNELIK